MSAEEPDGAAPLDALTRRAPLRFAAILWLALFIATGFYAAGHAAEAQREGDATGPASAGPPKAAVGQLEQVVSPPTPEQLRLQQQSDTRPGLPGRRTPVEFKTPSAASSGFSDSPAPPRPSMR